MAKEYKDISDTIYNKKVTNASTFIGALGGQLANYGLYDRGAIDKADGSPNVEEIIDQFSKVMSVVESECDEDFLEAAQPVPRSKAALEKANENAAMARGR